MNRVLRLALWFGLAGGLGESALYLVQRFALHRYLRLNPDLVWMAPLSAVVVMLVPAIVLMLLDRRRPDGRWWQVSLAVFASLALYGLLLFVSQVHDIARMVLAAGIGVQAARLAAPRRERIDTLIRWTLPALAVIVAIVAGVTLGAPVLRERRARGALAAADASRPNVLLLILDTVRALELSLYGYPRQTSPMMTRFAARGVVFDHAIAPAPWTLPSHASMFTGRDARELSASWRAPLNGRFPTLAEALRARGYLTAGFAGNLVYTARSSGLARGFVHYEDFPVTPCAVLVNGAVVRHLVGTEWIQDAFGIHDLPERWKGPDQIRDVAAYLAKHQDHPWFAFVNFYDAHNPYLPPAPYDTLFAPRAAWRDRNEWLQQTDPVTPAQAQVERNYYDGALAWLDNEVGTMLADLESRGLLRNTVVVIVADHGEEFGEHGLLDHGNSIYLPALHVPLVIVGPNGVPAGRRVTGTVSTRDVAATILDLAGVSPISIGGRSLRAAWADSGSASGAAVAEVRQAPGLPDWFPVSRGGLSSAVTDDRQIIHGSGTAEEVYDLRADPAGAHAARDSGEALARLRALVPAPPR